MGVMRWSLGAGIGVLVILSTVLGLTPAILVALVLVPICRRLGLAPAAGALTSFGAFWLALMLGQAESGGVLDNATFWIGAGVVPLVVGGVLTVRPLVRGVGREAAQPE